MAWCRLATSTRPMRASLIAVRNPSDNVGQIGHVEPFHSCGRDSCRRTGAPHGRHRQEQPAARRPRHPGACARRRAASHDTYLRGWRCLRRRRACRPSRHTGPHRRWRRIGWHLHGHPGFPVRPDPRARLRHAVCDDGVRAASRQRGRRRRSHAAHGRRIPTALRSSIDAHAQPQFANGWTGASVMPRSRRTACGLRKSAPRNWRRTIRMDCCS